MSNKAQDYIIDYKTFKSGIYEFDYHIDKDFFAMFGEPMVQDGDVDVHVTMKVSSAGLDIRLGIAGTLCVECDRCLEPFDMPVDSLYDLVVKFGDKTTPHDDADDMITIGADDDFLDLSQHIYEYVVLSLPARHVHPDNPDGTPGCDPEMLSHIIITDDDEDDDEFYDGEDMDDEDEDGDEPDGEVPDDGSEGEMETIEQKLSRDPRWQKIKAKLNNI